MCAASSFRKRKTENGKEKAKKGQRKIWEDEKGELGGTTGALRGDKIARRRKQGEVRGLVQRTFVSR
jgi:hypothetical protein